MLMYYGYTYTALALAIFASAAACTRPRVEETPTEPPQNGVGSIVRSDPSFNSIVPRTARIEKIAGGFDFTEGPMYMREGYLLFSDIPRNTIYKWSPDGTISEFRKPSGYDGTDAPKGALVGSNGITVDKLGRLTICEHGNHRVIRIEKNDAITVLADKFEGKRLNSPNDAVYKSDGSLYFTDPPYGLAKEDDDPKKELKFNGVYRLLDGKLQLLTKEMTRPNGIAFSPDEKYLYISNSDPKQKVWMRYEVQPDGSIKNGKVFFDVTAQTEDGMPDGMKVDTNGNVYGTGPGGIWVISPDGKHLGTIKPPETPANLHWGKNAGTPDQAPMASAEYATALYITARTSLYRIPLSAVGVRP
jgi:gluconolactonase